jgi:hypothetical protein
MTRLVEERVRAALRARAEQITENETDVVRLPTRRRPHRLPNWVPPMVVAAAVMMALAIPGALAVQRLTADPQPGTPGSTTAPPSSPSAPSSPPPSSTPPAPTSPAAPPSGTKTVSYNGMTLQIPNAWTLREETADPGWACVWWNEPNICEFTIVTVNSGQHYLIHPDLPDGVASYERCDADPDVKLTRLEASTVDIGGRTAQYRRFRWVCLGVEREFESWTLGTRPGVKFHRERIAAGTEDAVRAAVVSARFSEAETDVPLSDFGYITGYRRTPGEVFLTIDRATPVWRPDFRFDAENVSPRSYEYPVAISVDIRDRAPGLCRTDAFNANVCELDALLQRLDEGDNRADGGTPVRRIPVWLGIDGNGKIASISPA